MEVVVYYGLAELGILLSGKIVQQNLTNIRSHSEDGGFFGVEIDAIDAVLTSKAGTGTWIVSGWLGLKFRLNMPHRQTMDL